MTGRTDLLARISEAQRTGCKAFPITFDEFEALNEQIARLIRQRDMARHFARSWKRAATERRKRETAE